LLDWQPTQTQIGSFVIENPQWTYDGTNSSFHFWTRDISIAANGSSTFGFEAVYDPQNSSGIVNYTVTILLGSGGEVNGDNNIDSETILYFTN